MSTTLKTALLLGVMTALVMLVGSAFGQSGLVIAFVMAIVMNLGSYWFGDKIVLSMYNATEVGQDHRLYQIVARLAQKAGLPMPRVYTIPDMSPNAFATGRNPNHSAVAATEGILRLLPDSELEGVIAHELAHVKHRDILISTVAAMLAAAIMMLARWGMFFGGVNSRDDREGGGNAIAALAMVILAPFAAMLIQAAISRQREFAADRGGAEIVGSPTGLASALRHIDAGVRQIPMQDANPATAHMFIMKPFFGGGISKLFSSHPPTEERIAALMAYRP
jgi:heat shock protein HtpX